MKKAQKTVFILGAPRSGTTWLQKIFASHQMFVTGQESEFFTSYAAPVMNNYNDQLLNPSERGGTGLPAYFTEEEMYDLLGIFFSQMLDKIEGDTGSQIFLEKTPSHALVIDLINKVLPDSLFIHMVRSPIDVAASMMSAAQTWGKVWAPGNIWSASRMWKKHYASAKSSLDRIDGERKFVVHYEDLKRSPQSVIGNLAEHFSFPIDKNNIEDMVENSKSYRLKLYGEFSKRGTEKELLPEGFARLDTDKQQLPRVLNSLEKAFQKIYLHSEMKELGYLE